MPPHGGRQTTPMKTRRIPSARIWLPRFQPQASDARPCRIEGWAHEESRTRRGHGLEEKPSNKKKPKGSDSSSSRKVKRRFYMHNQTCFCMHVTSCCGRLAEVSRRCCIWCAPRLGLGVHLVTRTLVRRHLLVCACAHEDTRARARARTHAHAHARTARTHKCQNAHALGNVHAHARWTCTHALGRTRRTAPIARKSAHTRKSTHHTHRTHHAH